VLPERTCPMCGRSFIVPTTHQGPSRWRTCSRSCAGRGPKQRVPLAERFWRHVQRTETCWLWTGLHTSSGAGVLTVRAAGRARQVSAARVSWELHVGPLPPNRRLRRRCRRPACVRPDHLVFVRGWAEPVVVEDAHAGTAGDPGPLKLPARGGQSGQRRSWWTRERVMAGLRRFHQATGQAPTTSVAWMRLSGPRTPTPQARRYPSTYAVLRHFPSFRAAWTAAGIGLAHARWAPWTAADGRYLVTMLGVQPTAEIAATLGRGEAAVRTRARRLGLHVGDAHGWPLQRVATVTGIAEWVLRGYVERGELPIFKGAKHVYVDVGDVLVVEEIDWRNPPADLETAALRSLRWRLIQILDGRDWRSLRPHRPSSPQATAVSSHRAQPRAPRPVAIGVGSQVRVAQPVPAAPWVRWPPWSGAAHSLVDPAPPGGPGVAGAGALGETAAPSVVGRCDRVLAAAGSSRADHGRGWRHPARRWMTGRVSASDSSPLAVPANNRWLDLDAARRLLAEARSVDEVKAVRDWANARCSMPARRSWVWRHRLPPPSSSCVPSAALASCWPG